MFTDFQKNEYVSYCSGYGNCWQNRGVNCNGFWENYTAKSELFE
jgi:hypothetical protein